MEPPQATVHKLSLTHPRLCRATRCHLMHQGCQLRIPSSVKSRSSSNLNIPNETNPGSYAIPKLIGSSSNRNKGSKLIPYRNGKRTTNTIDPTMNTILSLLERNKQPYWKWWSIPVFLRASTVLVGVQWYGMACASLCVVLLRNKAHQSVLLGVIALGTSYGITWQAVAFMLGLHGTTRKSSHDTSSYVK
eukprot:4367978-Amphidinium_carterae.1